MCINVDRNLVSVFTEVEVDLVALGLDLESDNLVDMDRESYLHFAKNVLLTGSYISN